MKVSHLLIATAIAALGSTAASAQTTAANTTSSVNNPSVGVALTSVTPEFSITGNVAPSCVLGVGGDLLDINLGNVPIYNDGSNGVESLFTMSHQNGGGQTRTNLAGCNTKNRMTIVKNGGIDGLTNTAAAAAGYDSNAFQANIQYTVTAMFAAGAPGVTGATTFTSRFNAHHTEASDSKEFGAWKSNATFQVNLAPAAKALVAGDYTDTVNITLEAI